MVQKFKKRRVSREQQHPQLVVFQTNQILGLGKQSFDIIGRDHQFNLPNALTGEWSIA